MPTYSPGFTSHEIIILVINCFHRLGTEDLGLEYQAPQPVQTLLRLQVNVISVSCGALHTLALTDCGVSISTI